MSYEILAGESASEQVGKSASLQVGKWASEQVGKSFTIDNLQLTIDNFSPSPPQVRPATHADIPDILRLVNDHARRGDLLPRTAQSIHNTLDDWLVGEENGRILACVSLLFYTSHLAEVRSLAVHDEAKGQGWGSVIVHALIAEAKHRGVTTLFALTRAVRFFEKAGFTITDKTFFPEKVWRDCVQCPIQHRCDETAVVLKL